VNVVNTSVVLLGCAVVCPVPEGVMIEDDKLEVRDVLGVVVEFEPHEVCGIALAAAEPTRAARKRDVDACMMLCENSMMKSLRDI
jgi:hypothetical protein